MSRILAAGFALSLVAGVLAAETPPTQAALTLAGSWSGKWVDCRPGYAGNGGNFTGVVIEKEAGIWTGEFAISKTRVFKVELRGKLVDGKIEFNSAVNLGKFHGVYTFKGSATNNEFNADYEGPDEKGSFKMTRTN